MMKQIGILVVVMLMSVIVYGSVSYADTLEIAPAINKGIELAPGEKKKGFVDISNPTASTSRITLTVNAFKQSGDDGGLSFYSDERVAAGVKLDLDDFELGARETIRVYYLLDGTKLPQGAVFAAIFAQNNPKEGAGVQTVRVGSLLSITNGSRALTTASISAVQAPLLQIGDGITITADVANKSTDPKATGVFPQLTYSLWPYQSTTVEGPLVYQGITRSVEYRKPGNYLGLIRASVSAGENTKSVYIIAIAGFWRWLLPIGVIVVVGLGFLARWYRKSKH
jgi:hypothetical protein